MFMTSYPNVQINVKQLIITNIINIMKSKIQICQLEKKIVFLQS